MNICGILPNLILIWPQKGAKNTNIKLRVVEQRAAEYRMSKEGILSILSKKIERSDSILRHSSFVTRPSSLVLRHSSFVIRFFRVSFSISLAAFQASCWAETRIPDPKSNRRPWQTGFELSINRYLKSSHFRNVAQYLPSIKAEFTRPHISLTFANLCNCLQEIR